MNQTTADSRKWQVIVGGDTVSLEDGTIQMPPEQAKSTEVILNNIIIGNFQEIKMENCKAEQVLSKAKIVDLEKYRAERKTEKALARRIANQR